MNFLKRFSEALGNPVVRNWAAILVASILMVGTTVFYLVPFIAKTGTDALERQYSIALQGRNILSLFMDFISAELAQFGDELLSTKDPRDIDAISAAFLRAHPNFLTFVLTDANGMPRIAGSQNGEVRQGGFGVSDADTQFFQEAAAGNRYESPVYFGPAGPTIRISQPVLVGALDTFAGVIAVEVNLSDLWSRVTMPLVSSGKVYVVDSSGTIIIDPDPVRAHSGENLRYRSIVDQMLAGEAVLKGVTYVNELNVPVIATGVRMAGTGWGIIVEQEKTAVDTERRATSSIAIAFFGAALLLILALATATVRLMQAMDTVNQDAAAIATEKNKTELVLSGVTDAVVAVDLERKIIVFNAAAERLTGYQSRQAMGKPIESLIKIFDGLREVSVEEYCPMSPGGEAHAPFGRKTLRLTASGREAFVDLISGEVEGGEKSNVGCILTIHDITREHLFEKLKRDFVTVAAHQLRTPLSAIKWTFNMVLDGDLGALTPEQRTYLMRGFESTNRLIALVNDMLDVDRLESGTARFTLVPSILSNLTESIVTDSRQEADKHGVALEFPERPKREVKVNIDADKMRAALQNLVDNAIKYTPQGGKVLIELKHDGNFMIFAIKDTGIGIPVDQQGEMFRRFFRARNAVKQETDGSGLGLYLTKNIVERHGGRIWFDSSEGKGAIFYVALPIWVE